MKIIYFALIELEIPSGPTIHTLNLLKGFQKTDAKVKLLCPKPSKKLSEMQSFDCSFIPFFGYGHFRLQCFNFFALLTLLVNLLTFKPDVIYVRDRPGNFFLALCAKLFNIPFFIEMNGVFTEDFQNAPQKSLGQKLHHNLRSKQFLWTAGLIFNCPQLLEKYSNYFQINKEKLTVVSMYVDTELFMVLEQHACKQQLNIPQDTLVVGYVGGFSSRHDIETLKEIILEFETQNIKAMLLLVGDTNDTERKEKLLKALKKEQIKITGWLPHSEIPLYINAMDIGTALTKKSLGNNPLSFLKIKEYLACGVPVLLNSISQSSENSYPSHSVRILSNEDSQAISKTLLTKEILEAKKEQNSAFKKELSDYIHESFNLQKAAQKTIVFFEKSLL